MSKMKEAKDGKLRTIKMLKTVKVIGAIILIAISVALVWLSFEELKKSHFEFASSKDIDITPEKISEIRSLKQWEFLSIVDEEVVDTVRHNLIMADDRLSCIYQGTLRLGIDLTYAPDDWAVCHGDTVLLTLPAPRLLDNDFIDEAKTRVFYERGRWGASAKEQMYRRAHKMMRTRALTSKNIDYVSKQATKHFTELFRALGAEHVIVTIETEEDGFIR